MDDFQVTLNLAYYPPYHSKYNPIERVWGVLEKHWNGSLLDTCDTVLQFAQTLTFRGRLPLVQWLEKIYHTGVRLTQKQMAQLEQRFERLPGLAKWFVRTVPLTGPDSCADLSFWKNLKIPTAVVIRGIPFGASGGQASVCPYK